MQRLRGAKVVQSHHLEEWYDGLFSRTVDLVGDYAGDELFIIEGDSLLLHSFSDPKLDFIEGLQLLHATYIVEKFLRALLQRKCHFHVVFFSKHAEMCVPPHTPVDLHSRYLLAREAIKQHLIYNLPPTVPSIEVKTFECYRSVDFAEYLTERGAYFIMCHDGSFPQSDIADKNDNDRDTESPKDASQASLGRIGFSEHDNDIAGRYSRRVIFRSMIYWFICCGYNIALVTSVECRDTKVMAMIVEGSRAKRQQAPRIQRKQASDDSRTASESDVETEIDILEDSNREPTGRQTIPEEIDLSFNKQQNLNKDKNKRKLRIWQEEVLKESLVSLNCTSVPVLTQRTLLVVVTLSLMFKCDNLDNPGQLEARAMLLHVIALQDCRLSDRSVVSTHCPAGTEFLKRFVDTAGSVLVSDSWRTSGLRQTLRCDMADLLDGRLFLNVVSQLQGPDRRYALGPSLLSSFELLASWVRDACGVNLQFEPTTPRILTNSVAATQRFSSDEGVHQIGGKLFPMSMSGNGVSAVVLPFSNPVFDAHLSSIRLTTSASVGRHTASRTFKELSHWHNHTRPIDQKVALTMTEWQKSRSDRRNQLFMAEMRDYAASLTNAVGATLRPETIIVTSSKGREQKPRADTTETQHITTGPQPKKNSAPGGKKKGSKNNVRDVAAAAVLEAQAKTINKQIEAWTAKRAGFDTEQNLASRFLMTKNYLRSLAQNKRVALEAEVATYQLSTLVEMWIMRCVADERARATPIVGLIWSLILQITRLNQGVTADIASCVANTVDALRLPVLEPVPVQGQRELSFRFVDLGTVRSGRSATLSPLEFQLVHAGPYLDRNIGSAPDPRVHGFEPDKWQRDVLDQIDAKNSVFVVAPTSAGKTFISFYAIKKILEEDDDGVLVYVAPTKALVNQIAAEIQARFSKTFKHPAKSVWAIHTRDYRINNPTGCQVLVTVPHMLQIMLLAPTNASAWSPRVKRIIFDEIHCIGQADDGVVWEQLLLLAPCPIIALSATVGNPRKFSDWLSRTQQSNGIHLEMIEHRHRYSDLRKYVYNPPRHFLFNGFSAHVQLPSLGLDDAVGLTFMHPIASLVDRSRGMPDDLSLEPRDCWTLWNAMRKHQTEVFPVDDSVDPFNCLPTIVRKANVIHWEAQLKTILKTWIEDHNSPFEKVVQELEHPVRRAVRPELQISTGKLREGESPRPLREMNRLDTTLPLICSLHDQGALPALFFDYDRSSCELICRHLLGQLQGAESRWKESSHTWETQLTRWQNWKQAREKHARRNEPKTTRRDRDDNETMTRVERMRDAGSYESSPFASFDPDFPVDGFHLADAQKLTPSELHQYTDELKARLISDWLVEALKRGIGVHHAGLNRKYRQVCEILFRRGYLRVVIATGTLALGINMPCKTVVFSGDSIFLTALNFRQAAGRAGRRGFDVLGNVVFQGVPYPKVCRLLSSRLPDLNGHFPITTSLVLRLFILLHESKHATYAVKAINSILSCPRIYLGGPESKQTVLHHLRFSIEYLRRNNLLNPWGAPLSFAGCVSHLYYTGNAGFAFHALLKDGYFSRLCTDIIPRPKPVLLTLMLVMSHLFGRQYLRQSVLESHGTRTRSSSSVVILPPLPKAAAKILQAHDERTLDIYAAYVSTFIDQHVKEPDYDLPLTGMRCGGEISMNETGLSVSALPPVRINSAFVALSGHRDKWERVSDLCKTVRGGVWLEEAVIPHAGNSPIDGTAPLNAYLYDFFKHGNVLALEKENRVRRGDIWFVLNDFSLVLATIVTSLQNFLKLSPTTGTEMLDVVGSGDMREFDLDERVLETKSASSNQVSSSLRPTSKQPEPGSNPFKGLSTLKREKLADSWDDEESDGMADPYGGKTMEMEKKGVGRATGQTKEIEEDGNVRELRDDELLMILKAFTMLQAGFNQKFKAMWA